MDNSWETSQQLINNAFLSFCSSRVFFQLIRYYMWTSEQDKWSSEVQIHLIKCRQKISSSNKIELILCTLFKKLITRLQSYTFISILWVSFNCAIVQIKVFYIFNKSWCNGRVDQTSSPRFSCPGFKSWLFAMDVCLRTCACPAVVGLSLAQNSVWR